MRSAAVDNLLFDLPTPQKLVMEALRDIIFNTVKEVQESVKWNVPMYSHNGLLCYINYDKKHKSVVLAMIEGFMMEDKYKLFVHDTSNVKKILVAIDQDVPVRKIRYYLREGIRINQTKTKNFMSIQKKKLG
jgi:hypothetical protein